MSYIDLENVSRFYLVGKNHRKYVLRNVTISFPYAGLISVLGKSGCGKSTLLNLIGKLDNPSEGAIYYEDEDISRFKEKRLQLFRKETVSYIFQHYHLLENQTVLYNVMLPALLNGDSFAIAKNKAMSLIKDYGIKDELLNKKCSKLSVGKKKESL